MQLKTAPQAPPRPPQPRLLLPGSLRAAGTAVLAGCAATAVLAAFLSGHGGPGRSLRALREVPLPMSGRTIGAP